MAPEIYDDERQTPKIRDPKTDVFAFALILFELFCGHKVFPSGLSAAIVMRRAMGARPSDRPVLPPDIPPLVRELISRSWNAVSQKRPSFSDLWKRIRDSGFKFLPGVPVVFAAGPVDDS
jgi:hypothetical protein